MQFSTTWIDARTKQPVGEEIEDHDTLPRTTCDCGAEVWTAYRGTTLYAQCAWGHQWVYCGDGSPRRPGGWTQINPAGAERLALRWHSCIKCGREFPAAFVLWTKDGRQAPDGENGICPRCLPVEEDR